MKNVCLSRLHRWRAYRATLTIMLLTSPSLDVIMYTLLKKTIYGNPSPMVRDVCTIKLCQLYSI